MNGTEEIVVSGTGENPKDTLNDYIKQDWQVPAEKNPDPSALLSALPPQPAPMRERTTEEEKQLLTDQILAISYRKGVKCDPRSHLMRKGVKKLNKILVEMENAPNHNAMLAQKNLQPTGNLEKKVKKEISRRDEKLGNFIFKVQKASYGVISKSRQCPELLDSLLGFEDDLVQAYAEVIKEYIPEAEGSGEMDPLVWAALMNGCVFATWMAGRQGDSSDVEEVKPNESEQPVERVRVRFRE